MFVFNYLPALTHRVLVIGLLFGLPWFQHDACSQESEADNKQLWLSSVVWLDESTLVATQSEGLLLRPGKVVEIHLEIPQGQPDATPKQDWRLVGESDSSVWSAILLNDKIIASDYRGRVVAFHQGNSRPFQCEARWIRKIASIPGQQNQFLAGTEDGKLIVLSTESNSEINRIDLGNAAIFDIAFRPDGAQIAVACGDGNIHLRNWPGLEGDKTLSGQGNAVWTVLYVGDGQQLVSGGSDRKVRLWNIESGKLVVSVASTPDWISCLSPIPDSSLVAAGCLNGEVVLVDTKTLLPVENLKVAPSGIWSMALSPSGTRLALATRRDGLVLVSDLSAWVEVGKTAAAAASQEYPPEPPVTP